MKPTPSEITNETLYQEFNTVVAETEHLLKSVATAGGEKAGALKANMQEALTAAAERLEQIRQQALSQANAAARATDTYVRDNPWRAVGIVAALSATLGLVAGLLIARR
jgi:ElaB/YqjD/DUF883 family membrane-anchored ribosome-binding protein